MFIILYYGFGRSLHSLHVLVKWLSEILTFWMPTVYTFKFLMEKDVKRIPTILKFWCMISCYSLLSVLLRNILDEYFFFELGTFSHSLTWSFWLYWTCLLMRLAKRYTTIVWEQFTGRTRSHLIPFKKH